MYPWAVAVWALYPMAMIEVVSDVNLGQEAIDNDLIGMLVEELFTSKYFKIYNSIPGVAPVDMFPRTPCAYMVYMDASFIPFGRDFLNTHVAALVKDPRPIVYWQGDKIAIAVMHARPDMKVLTDGGTKFRVESEFTIRIIGDQATFADLVKVCGGPQSATSVYYAIFKSGDTFYQRHLEELVRKYPPMPNRPCGGSNSRATTSIQRRNLSNRPHQKFSYHNKHHNDHQRQRDRVYLDSNHRCAPPDNLIIDAMYVPMPIVGDNTENASLRSAAGPSLWLTSSTAPLSFKTIFATFQKAQIETIVQHLDPILQNSYMQKITSLLPSDITYAFSMFDAINYPDVISLRDMEYPHWGEKCPARIRV